MRLEREISELSATLLPAHPRMRQLHADLEGLKRQIAGEVAKIAESLDKEAKVAAMREQSVTKSLDELKSQVVTASTSEVELRALEAVAKSKRAELERMQSQFDLGLTSLYLEAVQTTAETEMRVYDEAQKGPTKRRSKKASQSSS